MRNVWGRTSPQEPRKAVSIGALLQLTASALLIMGIFVLPFREPPSSPSISASWEFGFNNNLARELIALFLGVSLIFRLLQRSRENTHSPLSRALFSRRPDAPVRPLLIAMIGFQVGVTTLVIGWFCFLPYAHFGEMTYFIQRLDMMLLGRLPFWDFHFYYGPAMLWPTLLLFRLSGPLLSIEAAYLVTLVIHYILGLGLIAYAVSQLRSRSPALIFSLVAFPFINLTMGLNYTPLRFAIAPASLLAIRHLFERFSTCSTARLLLLSFAAFLLPILTILFSPEMGLALGAALTVYFGSFLCFNRPRCALPALGVLSSLGVLMFKPAWVGIINSAGSGSLDFPLLPTIHVIAMLAAAAWLVPRLGGMALTGEAADSGFCCALATLLGLMLLPATGRSDPGHIYFNNLLLFLVVLSSASWARPAWKYSVFGGFLVIFPVFCTISFWNDYRPAFQRAVVARLELSRLSYARESAPPFHSTKLLPVDPWLEELPQAPIGIPLGADEATERFLTFSGRAAPEFYIEPHSDLAEPGQLSRKFRDLAGMRLIYVPTYYLHFLDPADPVNDIAAQEARDNAFLSSLMLFPVDLPAINSPFNPQADIMRRIARDYVVIKRCPVGVLLQRRN